MWVIFGRSWAYSRRAPREGCHHREARHLLGCTCTPALGGAHAGVLAPLAAALPPGRALAPLAAACRLPVHLHPCPRCGACRGACTPGRGAPPASALAPLAEAAACQCTCTPGRGRRLPVHLHPWPRPAACQCTYTPAPGRAACRCTCTPALPVCTQDGLPELAPLPRQHLHGF